MAALTASTSAFAGRKAFAVAPRQQAVARGRLQVQAYKVTFVSEETGMSKTAEIGPNEYLLDGADEHRIEVNASCRGGVCGTCVSKLRSGQVDLEWLDVLDEGSVLSQEQVKDGYILPCSAKPLSDCVVEINNDWGVHIIENWKHTARA